MTDAELARMANLGLTLLRARNLLQRYAIEFGRPNFTDRYGDAQRCREIVQDIDEILRVESGPPAEKT